MGGLGGGTRSCMTGLMHAVNIRMSYYVGTVAFFQWQLGAKERG